MSFGLKRLFNSRDPQYCHKFRAGFNAVACNVENLTLRTCFRYSQFGRHQGVGICQNVSPIQKICSRNFSHQTRSSVSSSSSRVSEQIVLYTNNNTKFLKVVNLFGFSFSAFWFFTAYQFATMRITPAPQRHAANLPWYARFDLVSSQTAKVVATVITGFLGCAVLSGAWMYSLRSVGKVILGKAGKTATFVTYNPMTFSMSKAICVDISEVSCQGHRSMNDVVPVKVRGKWMHFLLSREGMYHNAPLFDRSVGLRRTF